MGDLSKHFSRYEFKCHCGKWWCTAPKNPSKELIDKLEIIRIYSGGSLSINSGCRCRWYNRKIGGVSRSKHLFGLAADIVSNKLNPKQLADLIESLFPGQYGLGRYITFTHFDVRGGRRARWGQKLNLK